MRRDSMERDSAPGSNAVVDVRVVLFTVADGELLVCVEPDGSLPRQVSEPFESLDLAAHGAVYAASDLKEQYLEQLYTLSANDNGKWTIVISYIALVCSAHDPPGLLTGSWRMASEAGGSPPIDSLVVEYGITRLRAKLGYTNIAFHLLPGSFVLSELQRTYETILDRTLDKRNFRRSLATSGILEVTGDYRRDGSHRPAQLYRFRSEPSRASFLTPTWTGTEPAKETAAERGERE